MLWNQATPRETMAFVLDGIPGAAVFEQLGSDPPVVVVGLKDVAHSQALIAEHNKGGRTMFQPYVKPAEDVLYPISLVGVVPREPSPEILDRDTLTATAVGMLYDKLSSYVAADVMRELVTKPVQKKIADWHADQRERRKSATGASKARARPSASLSKPGAAAAAAAVRKASIPSTLGGAGGAAKPIPSFRTTSEFDAETLQKLRTAAQKRRSRERRKEEKQRSYQATLEPGEPTSYGAPIKGGNRYAEEEVDATLDGFIVPDNEAYSYSSDSDLYDKSRSIRRSKTKGGKQSGKRKNKARRNKVGLDSDSEEDELELYSDADSEGEYEGRRRKRGRGDDGDSDEGEDGKAQRRLDGSRVVKRVVKVFAPEEGDVPIDGPDVGQPVPDARAKAVVPPFGALDGEDLHYLAEYLVHCGSDLSPVINVSSLLNAASRPSSEPLGGFATSVMDHMEEGEGEEEPGCSRLCGYVKDRKKRKDLIYIRPPPTEEERAAAEAAAAELGSQKTREQRTQARRRAAIQQQSGAAANLLTENVLKTRKKKLRFDRSRIHDWGLFSEQVIEPNELVIEYVGEVVRQAVADIREAEYETRGIGSSYLFRIDNDNIIDATFRGSIGRFINHSCDPNCFARTILVDNSPRIVIYSKKRIVPGDEITFDYKFQREEEKLACYCGASNCSGFLN